MLLGKVQGAGGAKKGALTFSEGFTNFLVDTTTTTYTVPASGPQVGDIAVIHYMSYQGYFGTVPAGWTQISSTPTNGNRQAQRVMYKILTSGDLGSVLTLITNSSLSNDYFKVRLIAFRPSSPVTGVNISSLSVNSGTLPVTTKDTSVYPAPDIIFAAGSFDNGGANGGYSETYWTQEYINAGAFLGLITAFEIQNTTNTNRTITPLFYGTGQINHSFVLNAVV